MQGAAEKTLRYTPITSYEDLFSSLRLNIKLTGSVHALKSRLESCKQEQTETLQNFSIRFKRLVNQLRYAIQSKPSASPLKRRARLQVEEEDNINRYLLNLKREIGSQVRLMNPKTSGEAQNFASETEMWMKDSHQSTKQQIVTLRPPVGFINKPTPPSRTLANTTPQKAYNESMPLVDRSFDNASTIHRIFRKARPRNGPPKYEQSGDQKQWKNYSDKQEMTQEEITEQINYEERAKSLHYPEDCSQYTEENQMDPYTDC